MGATFQVEAAESVVELERHQRDLEALSRSAFEDNGYVDSAFLVPLLRHHGDAFPFRVALVRRGDGVLVGCAPFSVRPPSLEIPLPVLATLVTPHGRMMQPLLHRDCPKEALHALFDWMTSRRNPWRMVTLEHVSTTSPFRRLLDDETKVRQLPVLARHVDERPMLERRDSFEAYLADLPSSRRKAYRRHLRDLERLGKVDFRLHRDLKSAPDLADRFMSIEAKSWKGATGTALAASDHDRRFFRECVARYAERGALFFVELRLDEKAIAMSTNFVVGQTLFAFKIGYDPAYSDHSPGTLVEIEGIRRLHEEPGLLHADSGSTASSYVRAYFRETARLEWLWIGTGLRGRLLVAALPWLVAAKRRVRPRPPSS